MLFRNGERLQFKSDNKYNCDNNATLYFGNIEPRINELNKLKSLEIEALRIWTRKGFVQEDFSKENSVDFIKSINCILTEL